MNPTDLLKLVLTTYRNYDTLDEDLKANVLLHLDVKDLKSAKSTEKMSRDAGRRVPFLIPLFKKQIIYNHYRFTPLPITLSDDNILEIRNKIKKYLTRIWFRNHEFNDSTVTNKRICELWYIIRYLELRRTLLGDLFETIGPMSDIKFSITYQSDPNHDFSLSKHNFQAFMDTLTIAPESRLNLNLDPKIYDDFNKTKSKIYDDLQIHADTIYWNTHIGHSGDNDISKAHDFKGSEIGLTRNIGDYTSRIRKNESHTVNPINIFLMGCNLFVPSVIKLHNQNHSTTHRIGEFHEWPDTVSTYTQRDLEVVKFIRKHKLLSMMKIDHKKSKELQRNIFLPTR